MKSFSFKENVVLCHQDILDFHKNLLICIYQEGAKFGFRFLMSNQRNKPSFGEQKFKTDPVVESDNYNWAFGPFSSSEQAEEKGREYYRNYGLKVFENQVVAVAE